MIILGIDPGTATTGFGVLRFDKNGLECLDFGCIETSSQLSQGERLKILERELNKVIKKHRPSVMAVEDIFFFKNMKTAVAVSEARGVIILTAAKMKLSTHEYTPLQIKQTVTAYGRADKKQVAKMVQLLLNLKYLPKPDDAADALAAAICYTRTVKI